MQPVVIYTSPVCPYCKTAKALLASKGASWEEIDISASPEVRAQMVERANGRQSVPQIFIGDTHVGGNDDLQALNKAGKLDALLAG